MSGQDISKLLSVMRSNRRQQMDAELQAANFTTLPPEPPPINRGIPSHMNDETLAAYLAEEKLKRIDQDAEQKITALEASQEERKAAEAHVKDTRKYMNDRILSAKAGAIQADEAALNDLGLRLNSLMSTFPPNWTPRTLGKTKIDGYEVDQLSAFSHLVDQSNAILTRNGQPPIDESALARGGPMSPINQMFPVNQPAPQPQQTQVANAKGMLAMHQAMVEDMRPPQRPEQQRQYNSLVEWDQQKRVEEMLLETAARAMGLQGGRQQLIQNANTLWEDNQAIRAAQIFRETTPNYPDTPEAERAIENYMTSNGIPLTVDGLRTAHNALVSQGAYQQQQRSLNQPDYTREQLWNMPEKDFNKLVEQQRQRQ